MSFTKRIIGMLLCLIMVASLIPCALSASAINLSNAYRLTINGSYVMGMPSGVTVAELMASVHSSAVMKNPSGVVVSNTDTSMVSTGYVISYSGTEYTIIVAGDVDGDGLIKTNDYTALKLSFKGISLNTQSTLAADIDMDGLTSTSDYILLAKHVKSQFDINSSLILSDDEKATITPEAPVVSDFANSGTIHFDGTKVTVSGTGVSVVDNYAYVTASGEYTVTGTSTNAYIHVNANTEEKVKLILSGTSITNTSGSAIFFEQCKKAFIVLADGTSNSLTDGTTTTLTDKGALFSNDTLQISGNGSLTVTGNRQHGICSDDDIIIKGGNITVTNAVKDAFHANDDITVKDGTVTVTNAGSDAMESEGTINVVGGTINITSPSGNALKAATTYCGTDGTVNVYSATNAVKGDTSVVISGGAYNLVCTKNAIKSDLLVDISGGTFKINSSSDGIKSSSLDSTTTAGETRTSFAYTSLNGSVASSGTYVWTTGTISNTAVYWNVAVAESNGSGGYVVTQVLPSGTAKNVTVPTSGILVMSHISDSAYSSCCLIQVGDVVTYNTSTSTVTVTTGTNYLGDVNITGGNFHITCGNDGIQAGSNLVINNNDTKKTTASGIATSGSYNMYIISGGGYSASFDSTAGSYKAIKADDKIEIKNGVIYASTPEDTISCDENITISGGTITILTARDGISASNALNISGGTLNVTSKSGYSTSISSSDTNSYKGLKGTGSVTISNGTFNINTPDDAVHSNGACTVSGGTFSIYTGDDGFHSDTTMTVSGGTINIHASYEGVEGLNVYITGGRLIINSSDDGINAAGGSDSSGTGGNRPGGGPGGGGFGGGMGGDTSKYSLNISGDNTFVWMNCTGDGLDSNGSLTISGGTVIVQQSGGGNSGLDADGTRAINGGLVIICDGGDMIELPSASTQPVISYTMSSSVSANTLLNVQDSSGNTIFTYKATISYKHIMVSSPSLNKGSSYKIYTGGSCTGTADNGLYKSGTYTAGTLKKTVTLSSTVTSA